MSARAIDSRNVDGRGAQSEASAPTPRANEWKFYRALTKISQSPCTLHLALLARVGRRARCQRVHGFARARPSASNDNHRASGAIAERVAPSPRFHSSFGSSLAEPRRQQPALCSQRRAAPRGLSSRETRAQALERRVAGQQFSLIALGASCQVPRKRFA